MAEFEVVVQRIVVEELVYRCIEADSPEEAENICLEWAQYDDCWVQKQLVEEDYCVTFCDGDF